MKVRIKKTGEVLEVAEYAKVAMDVCDSYGNPLEYGLDEIEIVEDVNRSPDIDWQQVTNQAAIGAMQVMLAKQDVQLFVEDIADFVTYEIALKLKEMRAVLQQRSVQRKR